MGKKYWGGKYGAEMMGRKIKAEGKQARKQRKRWLGNAGEETQDKKCRAGNDGQESFGRKCWAMLGRKCWAGNAG